MSKKKTSKKGSSRKGTALSSSKAGKTKREPMPKFLSGQDRFRHATRGLNGRFVSAKEKEKEIRAVEKIKKKNPRATKEQIRRQVYPTLPTFKYDYQGDALTFKENVESYIAMGTKITIIDANGQKFTYNKRQTARAESLLELTIGNAWREASKQRADAQKGLDKRHGKNKKKAPTFIPNWKVQVVEKGDYVDRVVIDFSKSNLYGTEDKNLDEFMDIDEFENVSRDHLDEDDDGDEW